MSTICFVVNVDVLPKDEATRTRILNVGCDTFRVVIYYYKEHYYSYMIDKSTLDEHGYYPIYVTELGEGPKGHFRIQLDDDGEHCSVSVLFRGYDCKDLQPVLLPSGRGSTFLQLDYAYGIALYDADTDPDDLWENPTHYVPEDRFMLMGVLGDTEGYIYGENQESTEG